jgi:DNA-binding Xre family transcriptional regulator
MQEEARPNLDKNYRHSYNFYVKGRWPMTERLNLEALGERLRLRRKQQEMTQQELAALMVIPQSWISEVETGKRPHVEADTIYRFCQALDCSLDYLAGLVDDPRPPKRPRPRTTTPVG